MATLSESDRFGIWADFMSNLPGPTALEKGEIREAVDAVDDWLDAADDTITAALPEPAKSELTAEQRRRLFMLVLTKRHERQA